MWKERLGRRHSPSLVAAGGNFVDGDGETFVVRAGPAFALISHNSQLLMHWPAVAPTDRHSLRALIKWTDKEDAPA